MADIAVRNGTIIDGTGSDPIPEGTLTISGDRIDRVSPEDTTVKGQATVIDASGKTVLPGLLNLHDHTYRRRMRNPDTGDNYRDESRRLVAESATYLALLSASNALHELKSGITTVREVGAGHDLSVSLRRAFNDDLLPGPRMVVCGKPISMTGGHGANKAREADGPDEVRKAARAELETGVNQLKFMASGGLAEMPDEHPDTVEYNEQELRAGIEEAHKQGKKTCAHAHATEAIENAVRAGIDSIEHGMYIDEGAAELMREHDTDLVPTLSNQYRYAEYYREAGHEEFAEQIHEIAVQPSLESFARAAGKGVRFGVGTDSTGHMVEEMALMRAAADISPMKCLQAATGDAAEILGLDDTIGTLQPGLQADVIVVEGNPLNDLTALQNVTHVIRDGQPVFQNGDLVLDTLDIGQFMELQESVVNHN